MRFVSLSQIVYLGLLVCPALGEHILAPAPTDAGVDPVVTEAPGYPALVKNLDTRQLGGDFVAWWEDNSSWRDKTCEPGSRYATWSTYGKCCATTDSECSYATACAVNGMVEYDQGPVSCDPGQYCEVFTILPSSDSPVSEKRDLIQCISSGYNYPATWYRQSYALTTDPSTTTVTQVITDTVTQTQTAIPTETVATDGSTALQNGQAMQGVLGAFIVAVLVAMY